MTDTAQQLTFEVGGEKPTESLLRVSGGIYTSRELAKGEEVHLQVVDADGTVVADGYGTVVGVAFKDKRDEHGHVSSTERSHSVKVA